MSWDGLSATGKAASRERAAEEAKATADLFARVFGTPDGLRVLALLRERAERPQGSEASLGALAHAEGQRQFVRAIEQWTANGREQHPTALRREYPALG
jgi:hypothetical protein